MVESSPKGATGEGLPFEEADEEGVAVESHSALPAEDRPRRPRRPDIRLQALLEQHEEILVHRIDLLLREQLALQVQSLRKVFGDLHSSSFVKDEEVGGLPALPALAPSVAPAATASVCYAGPSDRPQFHDEAVAGPTRETATSPSRRASIEQPAESGQERGPRHSRLGSVHAPDMVSGALDLRKKFKARKTWGWSESLALQKFKEKNPVRGFFRQTATHPLFDTFFAAVVIFSVVMIGWEIEAKAIDPTADRMVFLVSQVVCCLLFMVEIFFRIGDQGEGFFCGKDYKWNLFDLTCLFAMTVELVSELSITSRSAAPGQQSATSGRILRVLRLMRIVRALRIMRATRTSREFRKMSYALQYSAQTLFWALLLLGFVMYFFATTFAQAASEELLLHGILPAEVSSGSGFATLVEMYGSIPKAFRSLFMAISSGRDWYELLDPLSSHLHWTFSALFVLFIAVTVFGIMNVLTSVFVESALQSVQHYKDLLIQESMKAKQMYVDHLREVFKEIDTDRSGSITVAEMQHFLADPSLMMYLESMDIQPDDALTLFRLLDKDDSGCVSIDEFCQGCLRLKGDAKSFDIHCIIFENQRILFKWKEYMNYIEGGLVPKLQKTYMTYIERDLEPALQKIVETTLLQHFSIGDERSGGAAKRQQDFPSQPAAQSGRSLSSPGRNMLDMPPAQVLMLGPVPKCSLETS